MDRFRVVMFSSGRNHGFVRSLGLWPDLFESSKYCLFDCNWQRVDVSPAFPWRTPIYLEITHNREIKFKQCNPPNTYPPSRQILRLVPRLHLSRRRSGAGDRGRSTEINPMYGVPADLDLSRLVGQEFNYIGLGRFQIQFHTSSLMLCIEGRWELKDKEEKIIDQDCEHVSRGTYRLHVIIDVPITKVLLSPPESFSIHFESEHVLTIWDDTPLYESFSIHFQGAQPLYV